MTGHRRSGVCADGLPPVRPATRPVRLRLLLLDSGVTSRSTFAGVCGAPGNPDILAAIEATGASTAVLVGLETDVCVAHSALGLKEFGKRVVAVHDTLFSPCDRWLCDGTRATGVAASSPGEAVTFLARRDLVVIVTACAIGYPPLNQGPCSPLRIEISSAAAP